MKFIALINILRLSWKWILGIASVLWLKILIMLNRNRKRKIKTLRKKEAALEAHLEIEKTAKAIRKEIRTAVSVVDINRIWNKLRGK